MWEAYLYHIKPPATETLRIAAGDHTSLKEVWRAMVHQHRSRSILGFTLMVTQAFLPLLGTDPSLTGLPGRIVNISSVGGKLGGPFLGAYVAAKHALEGLSESLRRELMLFGIDVIVVAPGAVATPIWDKAEEVPLEPLAATPYGPALRRMRDDALKNGRAGYRPEKVADVIWTALNTAKPAARYAVVINKLTNWTIPRLLPTRLVDRLIAAQLGLKSVN